MVNITLAHDVDNVNRTQDVQIVEDVTFDSMFLKRKTLEGLKKSGFCYPSPIQLLGIPLGKCGFDLLLEAKSGTGKTAVFTIIALEKLNINAGLQTIILAPTREIASQICDVVRQIGSGYKGLNVEVVIGGLSVGDDIKKFSEKVHILVGSPGRLKHLIQLQVMDISAVRLLVIDEADKLMENSFISDINYIVGVLPDEKQIIMSSATYPEDSKNIINNYAKNFQHICPDSNCVLRGVVQKVTVVTSNSNIVKQTQYRFKELLKILSKKQFKQCLIFCNYQVRVSELYRMLTKEQWPVELLYSKQEQIDRLDALKTLQEYKCRILISTDLAARGIDAFNVDLVINFEPPYEWQTYLHRIGRAGRFGSYGVAITILSEGTEVMKFRKLLKSVKNSITIQDFWTNETFKLDDDYSQLVCSAKTMPESGGNFEKEVDGYVALWDVLTSENMQHSKDVIRNIDSFDNLLDSFINTEKQSVQSFSDLIQSFDSTQEHKNEEHITYQTLKVNGLPIEDLLSVIGSKTTVESVVSDETHCEETSNIRNLNGNETNMKLNTDILNSENTEIFNNPSINQKVKEIEDCNKTMLDLGLPNSFSSKKMLDKKINRRNKSNHSYNVTNSELLSQSHQGPASSHKKHVKLIVNGNPPTSDDSEDEKGILSNSRSRRPARRFKSDHKSKQVNNVNMKQEYEYYLWYNQLQVHIKSLAMALYINEMSKL